MHNDVTKILQEDHPNWQDRITVYLRSISPQSPNHHNTIDPLLWIPRRYPDE